MKTFFALSPFAFLLSLVSAVTAISADWPQWRGPDRSNVSLETGLLKEWPTNGPPLLWKVTGLGTGIASVSVARGRVYTIGYRDGGEFVHALDAGTGEARWAARVGSQVNENSLMRWLSQRTPTLDEDRVYTMTASGELLCLRTNDGSKLWQKSYPNDFLSPRPTWGFCDYPLVDGERLICSPAGPGAMLVAFNKRTGEMIWKAVATASDEKQGYAATIVSEAGGIRQYVAFLSRSLVGIAASDGRVLWRYLRPATRTASSYTPIARGEFLFSANGYGGGMVLLKLARDGEGMTAQEQYVEKMNFNAFQDTTLLVGDHVYGFQAPGQPICIELKTGKLAWGPIDTSSKDRAALTCADGRLYIRRASGSVILADANPKEYIERGTFVIPDREEASGVTSPVVAERRLYLRDNDRLLCYDVKADALSKPRPVARTVTLAIAPTQSEAIEPRPPSTGRDRAPDAIFVPTPQDIVERMLELAQLKQSDSFYALGSGDGRFLITAVQKYGCKAVGYEINPQLVAQSRESVRKNDLQQLVRIEHEDLFTVDLSGADVIAVYLPPALLERLLPQLDKLRPGSRIVSHQFEIPNVPAEKQEWTQSKEDGDRHRLLLWTTPLHRSKAASD